MADALERERKLLSEPVRAGFVALEQVIRHALRGLGTDAGEAAQGGDELLQ